ncbi:cbb3-type cytochrome c oxidase subunit 3 [Parvularcula lutaonensis]|uniref:Cbb3-type cytochrome c oxidase subunit 3 n=1 Tax=Parvularcula lutaonensis TaxID=491923 RepID=A0ABV7MBY3_9PROT|nr:cbb3-type cytochrome c oxidase subunit 3 [Parvularcula lutaonensis]GGY45542.1 hypothetical protein GCM10007148_13180 [Parvularcula lutaonensis]
MHVLLSNIAQTFGLLLFIIAFALILFYALSPANKATFSRARFVPLDRDGSDDDQ